MIKKLQKLQLKKIATKEILMNYQENSWQKIGQELNMLNTGKHTVKDQN
jgi:ABC-type Fe2+-enterobactin transport system substrate-binding protein